MTGPNAQQVWDDSWWNQSGIDFNQQPQHLQWDTDPNLMPGFLNEMARLNAGQGLTRWQGLAGGANGGQQTGSPMAPGAPISGVSQIQTTIQPRDIYTQQMTQQRVNQAMADAHQRGNMSQLLKQFDRSGVSRSGRNTFAALPQYAQSRSDAVQAQAAIPLADEAANQQNRLRGEIAQGLEFNQLARLLLGQQSLNNWVQQSNLSGIGNILGSIGALI